MVSLFHPRKKVVRIRVIKKKRSAAAAENNLIIKIVYAHLIYRLLFTLAPGTHAAIAHALSRGHARTACCVI